MLLSEIPQMGAFNHPFTPEAWAAAKREAHVFLNAKAAARALTTYGELADNVTAINMRSPSGHGLMVVVIARFCGELSVESDHEGRGMISALIGSVEYPMPSEGFFTLAGWLGYDISPSLANRAEFWVEQLDIVFRAARRRARRAA